MPRQETGYIKSRQSALFPKRNYDNLTKSIAQKNWQNKPISGPKMALIIITVFSKEKMPRNFYVSIKEINFFALLLRFAL